MNICISVNLRVVSGKRFINRESAALQCPACFRFAGGQQGPQLGNCAAIGYFYREPAA